MYEWTTNSVHENEHQIHQLSNPREAPHLSFGCIGPRDNLLQLGIELIASRKARVTELSSSHQGVLNPGSQLMATSR